MSTDTDPPRVAPESGRPAPSEDPLTQRATVPPGLVADEAATPDDELEILHDEDATEEERRALETLREMGWGGGPFVTYRGEVVVESDLYAAAEQLGISERIPRIELRKVFEEAGYDLEEIERGYEPEHDPGEVLAEDFLRGLPRHVRDKYGI